MTRDEMKIGMYRYIGNLRKCIECHKKCIWRCPDEKRPVKYKPEL